uniref:probable carboxylesterase 18 n=1 Tax=Erigeron canadensis TaxID=72917 RepID=UPI001CB90E48|nr:probable carboxylesterase 18 [Erigeron canadensis]
MEVVAKKTPNSLSLPWGTRIFLRLLGILTDIVSRKDGTVNRRFMSYFESKIPPTLKPVDGLKTYDVVLNPTFKTWFRVYLPTEFSVEDLPVLVFYHGGGFSYMAANSKVYDDLCRNMATKMQVIVISVEYRLAPEFPHPAQYDDGIDALKYLDVEENRLKCSLQNANFSRCFVAGDSAGGNLVHHVVQRACVTSFKHLKVIGLLAIQPFFGGIEQTNSEKELDEQVPILTVKRTNWFWDVFMPEGKDHDRDHASINVSGPNAIDITKFVFPTTMVVVSKFDILHDWQKKYYEWLLKSGKEVELVEYPNMFHDFVCFPELPEADQLIFQMKEFIYKVFNKA